MAHSVPSSQVENPGSQHGRVIRQYREGDIPGIVRLFNAVSLRYDLIEGLSDEELRSKLDAPRSDPVRQVVVVEGRGIDGVPHGVFAGFGRVTYEDSESDDERVYLARVRVHPAIEGQGLERAIILRLVQIAHEYEAGGELEPAARATVKAFTNERLHHLRDAWESAGLKSVREQWTMARDLTAPIDEPSPIDGIEVRNYRYPTDNLPVLQAYNDSFADHWDYHGTQEDVWEHAQASPFVRHDLSWIAEEEGHTGAVAGFCICAIYPEDNKRRGTCEGWVDLLGTTRLWRRKGVGRALLLQGLLSLRSAGMDVAILQVDSESLTGANRLYESAGFRVRDREAQQEAALSAIPLPGEGSL